MAMAGGARKRLAEDAPAEDLFETDGFEGEIQAAEEIVEGSSPSAEAPSAGDAAVPLGELPECPPDALLRDVARALLSSGRAAAAVVGENGAPKGVVTEDDILRSYLQCAPWDVTVAEWMRGGGGASIPPAAGPDVEPEMAKHAVDLSAPAEAPLGAALASLLALPHAPNRDRLGAGAGALLVRGNGGVLSVPELARAVAERGLLLGTSAAATSVADAMEPVEEAPALEPGFSIQQLLHALLSSPARAVLALDGEGGVQGLATAADALWAFQEQLPQDEDAWEKLSERPGKAGLEGHAIPVNASLERAATAMVSTPTGTPHALLAVETDNFGIVGMLAPSHLVMALSERSAPGLQVLGEAEAEQDGAPLQLPIAGRRPRLHKRRRLAPRPHAVTVGDIVAQRETATLLPSETLVDAADTLVETGRTAAVVTDAAGEVRGVLTENDLLTALLDGTPWDCKIETWLRGGHARLPGFMLPALTLSPSTPLAEAAAEMTAQAEEGAVGTGFGCHHLLVRSGSGDGPRQVRLLSALDVAKGMIDAVAAQAAGAPRGIEGHAVVESSDMTVEQAMKERGILATCTPAESLGEAFEAMMESRQNCAVVVAGPGEGADGEAAAADDAEGTDERAAGQRPGDEHPCMLGEDAEEWQREHGPVQGVITAADALRAFSERQRGRSASVAGWLRALNTANASDRKSASQRTIRADESLSDAALAMGMSDVHHLVVLDKHGQDVVGVLSALDIVCTIGACYRFDLASPRGL